MDFMNFLAIVPAWVSDSFPIIRTVIIIVMVVLSVSLIMIILFQPSNTQGMGAITGQSDTFYSKNKSKTIEGVMRRLTVIISITLGVLSLLFFISLAIYSGGSI